MDKCCTNKCYSKTYPLIFILLVKSMRQKILKKKCLQKNVCSKFQFVKDLVCRLHIDQWTVSQSLDSHHLEANIFGAKNFFGPEIFLTQIFFDQKFFWLQNVCWTQNCFDLKLFLAQKIFWAKFCFDQNIFLLKVFWHNDFFGAKILQTQNFSR